MKFFLFLSAILIFAVNGHSQTYFKFIEENGEDIYGGSGEIVNDGNLSFAGLVRKGTEKIYTYVPWDRKDSIDFTATYFLRLDLKNYFPVWVEVDLERKDTLTISLEVDKNIVKEVKGTHYNICGEPIYGNYTPRAFRTWEEIPAEPRNEVYTWLENWIGKKNLKKLYISSGYILNGPEMEKAKVPHADDQIVYRMCLSFSDPDIGINQFSTAFNFSESGRVLNSPNLPSTELWNFDSAWEFMELQDIQKTASKAGYFKKGKTSTSFDFYPRQNTFIWEFTEFLGYTERGETKERSVYYDAFTGELLAIFFDKVMVMVD